MKNMKATLSVALLALLSLVFSNRALADVPDNVEGDWTIYSTNIENGETVVKHVQIAQYGNRITGYFEGPNQSGPIQGRINNHHIVFSTVTRNVLTFRGQIYGDNISGEYGLHGKHAAWQAVRPATAATTAPPATGAVYSSQPILAPPTPAPQLVSETTTVAPAQNNYAPQNYSQQPQGSYSQQPQGNYSQPPQNNSTGQSAPPAPAPLSSEQLNSMVAPIALYPDALVAQVLAASENPDQVAYADDWLNQNKNLTGSALAQAVDQQPWDPSVKALTQFPSVLDNMAHNLSWTSSLGQAFANQPADVMAAVQVMRAKAQATGTLQSNTQITVTQSAPNTIVIQPANPQVVYVPQYNPAVVYGAPVVVPYYVAPPVASVGLFFGSGITVGAVVGGGGWAGGFGWGWHAWNLNWGGWGGGGGGSTIIYNHTTYINNHTWNNYNGYHPWGPGNPDYHPWGGGPANAQNHGYYGPNGYYHPDPGYRPGADTHYGPNGAYHPNGYYGPDGGWHEDNSHTPNGGNNGNHGLIGGNGGVEHNPGYTPTNQQPNGGHNGDHGLIGGNGGVDHGPDVGRNGDHGLIGGNGGVQHDQGGMLAQNHADNNRLAGAEQNRSRFAGDGHANRVESNRGHMSMARSRPQRMPHERASMPHRSPGGGGRRR
jgi:hypothetical protein